MSELSSAVKKNYHTVAVRHHAQAVAARLVEGELGPEQVGFIEGCPAASRPRGSCAAAPRSAG